MRLSRLAITLTMLVSAIAIHADEASEIRKRIPTLQGEALLASYEQLYRLSMESGDFQYQLQCVNELIAETERQKNWPKAGDAKVMKILLFYNNGEDDSLYAHIHPTLDFLREKSAWKNYYEVRTTLVDVYNFTGKTSEALKAFNGHVIIQTMFMKGGEADNTSDAYVEPWLKVVAEIKPQKVMIYTIDRETPDRSLQKATHEELDAIRDRVTAEGIPCQASY